MPQNSRRKMANLSADQIAALVDIRSAFIVCSLPNHTRECAETMDANAAVDIDPIDALDYDEPLCRKRGSRRYKTPAVAATATD